MKENRNSHHLGLNNFFEKAHLMVDSRISLWYIIYIKRRLQMEPMITVSELIDILKALPDQDALVQISMNDEYQSPLRADCIRLEDDYVVIED